MSHRGEIFFFQKIKAMQKSIEQPVSNKKLVLWVRYLNCCCGKAVAKSHKDQIRNPNENYKRKLKITLKYSLADHGRKNCAFLCRSRKTDWFRAGAAGSDRGRKKPPILCRGRQGKPRLSKGRIARQSVAQFGAGHGRISSSTRSRRSRQGKVTKLCRGRTTTSTRIATLRSTRYWFFFFGFFWYRLN